MPDEITFVRSDDTSVGPDAARHTPPADDQTACTFPATWAGMMAFLDEQYPTAVFPENAVLDADDDLGPRTVRLARELAVLRGELADARARFAAVRALAERWRDAPADTHVTAAAVLAVLDGPAEAVSESSIHGDTVSDSNRLATSPTEVPADPHLSEWQTQMRGFLGKRVEVVLNKDPRKVVVGVLHHFDTDGQVYVEYEDGSWGWAWPCLDIAEAAESQAPEPDPQPVNTDLLDRMRKGVTSREPAEAPASEPVDDHVAAWIKAARDRQNPDGTPWDLGRWNVLDDLLDDYRLHRATGTPLDQHACEGSYCCADERAPSAAYFGPAEAAEPPRSPIEVAERAMFARRDAARLNATGVHDLDDVLRETGIDPAEVPPAPGYQRIADAIHAACEAADIDLTVVHDGRVLDYVPGVVWLATVLDKAGLIDWAAFADEAVDTAPEPDALVDAARHVLAEWSRMHPSGYLAMYPAMDALRAALAAAPVAPALIGTWADPEFRAHQNHKHPVEGCGYCPSEEDR